MPLYLRESDVEKLLPPDDAVEAVAGCFERLGSGQARNRPRYRIPLHEGLLNIMGAADLGLGVAGLKTYVALATGARFVVVLFDADSPEVLALCVRTLRELASRELTKPEPALRESTTREPIARGAS